ncbi:MAG: DUF488 domain-containing protein [Oscillatoriales cyanobacterium RU_3_3]|nr:DUF488 domain-containing protein [Oscillatoriales cyanobacterium RU_3_3]NJR23195.1 DUF488 domain-containing protein [Richelia sp. CSU_2_1]NJS42152.1 DUF488 domain-containing protein [Candidatus Gracilibacteria bacterium]
MELFTIGHSNLSIETFVSLLQKHQITAVADVRSHPYSRYLPHFSKSEIKTSLSNAGIQYVFLGKELGARPEDLSCYDIGGKALYDRIAATELFAEGIQRLLKGAASYKISLMCAEKDPITCHRTILVCHKIKEFKLQINHILSDGNLESHADLEDRLLNKFNKGKKSNAPIQLSLFETPPQVQTETVNLETAYHRQGLEIAYVSKTGN